MITEHKKPKRWQCLPTAFAMLTPLTPSDVMARIGHDGSEITHAGLPEPLKRRGFHIQEIIDVAFYYGYAMTEIQYGPTITPYVSGGPTAGSATRVIGDDDARIRFELHIKTSRGLLATHSQVQGHVWAYEDGIVYDPDGIHEPFSYSVDVLNQLKVVPVALWRLDRIAD